MTSPSSCDYHAEKLVKTTYQWASSILRKELRFMSQSMSFCHRLLAFFFDSLFSRLFCDNVYYFTSLLSYRIKNSFFSLPLSTFPCAVKASTCRLISMWAMKTCLWCAPAYDKSYIPSFFEVLFLIFLSSL